MRKHNRKTHSGQAGSAAPRSRPVAGGALTLEARSAYARLKGWRLWLGRLALAILLPVLLLGATEGLLRLAGYGYPTGFCLLQKKDGVFIQNDKFLWQFYSRKTNLRPNPFSVSINKPPGTARIVILGESAAAGTPDPAYNFGRILERMLRRQFPQHRIEVINAAMPGVNSHILLPVARDCLRFKPDCLVIYMGNNEAVGLYAPGPHSGRLTGCLHLLRLMQRVRASRLGQLLEPLWLRLQPEGAGSDEQDESFFLAHRVAANDPRREAVYENFRANLRDICAAAKQGGARVALMTVPVNLKDCPPFGSLNRRGLVGHTKGHLSPALSPSEGERETSGQARVGAHVTESSAGETALSKWQSDYEAGQEAQGQGEYSEALVHLSAAAAIDDDFADLHFRLAETCLALGQFDKARQEFIQARDWDALQFRTDSRLNNIIRQTAEHFGAEAVRLVDAEAALAEAEKVEPRVPGGAFFNDHVHPSFEGDYLLAKTLAPAVSSALGARVGRPVEGLLSRDECAAQLAFTRVNEGQIAVQMLRTTALAPFTAQLGHDRRQKAAEEQLALRFGNVTWDDVEAASDVYRAAIEQFPDDWYLPFNYARLRLLRGDYKTAIEQFEAARRLLPQWVPLRVGLATALSGAGREREALKELAAAQAREPESEAIKSAIQRLSGGIGPR
ncbi:MAG TPA: tetratricopeptide repeat protein [Verrucomicrobiae bacterium]|nr:tetratricopeptide repeat protein [Verrucomicrobiae bacterium]